MSALAGARSAAAKARRERAALSRSALAEHEALALAIVRQQADPGADGLARRARREGLAAEPHASARERPVARQIARAERGLAGAFEPGDADDLAAPDHEIDVGELGVAAAFTFSRTARPPGRRGGGKIFGEIAPHHRPHQPVGRHLRGRRR